MVGETGAGKTVLLEAIAGAFPLEDGAILLDEPFSALDPTTKQKMYSLLGHVHEQFDCTIVFVTHDFNEATQLADRVGIILGGSLQATCSSRELFTAEFNPAVRAFLGRD